MVLVHDNNTGFAWFY